jgi:hypothetical protein
VITVFGDFADFRRKKWRFSIKNNVMIKFVAQWTSHPPQEQEGPGSNPARV